MKKLRWTIGGTIAMIAVLLLGICWDRDAPNIYFLVNGIDRIEPWEDPDSGIWYIFLPSYAYLHETEICFPKDSTVTIDRNPIEHGTDCAWAEPGRKYTLSIGGQASCELCFVQSADVATMYVNTVTGSLEKIHKNKKHKEYAGIKLYTPSGDVDYEINISALSCQLRGHGNYTWLQPKRPYNLYFQTETNLLHMGQGNKWVLLANAVDITNLRNKIILDFARKIGPYPGFSPECAFVDLYINNQYYGLYLLCRSVDSTAQDIGIDKISYLFDTELPYRADYGSSIPLSSNLSVEIRYPDPVSKNEATRLSALLSEMQNALQSPDGVNRETGKRWNGYIDLDSWARKYLIEEVFVNNDATTLSQYYYVDKQENKIYIGPCWDYDISLNVLPYSNVLIEKSDWYRALWERDEFREHVFSLYKDVFSPELHRLYDTVISNEAAHIRTAAGGNSIRWGLREPDEPIAKMLAFLEERVAFLDAAWIDGVDYKTITLLTPAGVKNNYYAVPAGTTFESLPTPRVFKIEGTKTWSYVDTGKPFDRGAPITEDITLYADVPDRISKKSLLVIGCLFVFAGAFSVLALADQRQKRRD